MEDDQAKYELSSGASPFFSGSIAESIVVAKSEGKSLIVYIAEENSDCQRMDQTTWQDCKVQKTILEQFVTLRLRHGSTDAAHFSAMFPYREVPSISIINHNGMLLKSLGGYVSPAELLGILEQLTAMQNTAAIVAALASANAGSTDLATESQPNKTSYESECFESEKAGPSAMHDDSNTLCASAAAANNKMPLDDETNQLEHLAPAQIHTQAGDAVSETLEDEIKSQVDMQAMDTLSEISEVNVRQGVESVSCDVLSDEILSHGVATSRALETLPNKPPVNINVSESLEPKVSPCITEEAPKKKKSAETFLLQVRLTNGKSICKSFYPKDHLAAVKEFVDENRGDDKSSYSLAMLYPRKVFSPEDMEKSLLDLSLEDRATLVLVTSPLQQTSLARESTSSRAATSEVMDSGASGGIWKIFSYLNPLSYFSGSSTNTNHSEPGSSSWQYEPDPNLRSSLRQDMGRHGLSSSDVDKANTSKTKKASQERSWGGNIHTLEHNDDDEAFKRGNAFWNGNSTQYGGDDSKK
eukprot:c618_g1_i1 orf=189-1769(-)